MNTNHSRNLPEPDSARPRLALAAFVVLVFCTGTAEYLVAGVLPQLAHSVSVSAATAGQAVTAYALGVAIGSPVITVLTARLPRKGLALSLAALFIAGIALTALAPTFVWVIIGRVLSACSQATLFAIALTTAITVLGQEQTGRAVAIVSSGLTVATVFGVPLGALLGGDTSWRQPFMAIGLLALMGVALLACTMPRTTPPDTGVGDEIRALTRGPVLLAVLTTVVGFAGVSTVFTYLVPLLTNVSGVSSTYVPPLLLAYGVGGFIGNLAAGRLADLSLGRTITGVFLVLAATLGLFPMAFNLANAIGSALGGVVVAAGLMRSNGYLGAVLSLAGLGLSSFALRQSPSPNPSRQNTTGNEADADRRAEG